MKIQGHLQDYPLPALLEVLADRRESGCLRIAFEPEPAILHFKRGQLVAARMSLLQGPAAINLALSMEKAPFDFDNEVVPPQSVIDNHERAMFSRLLGVRLGAEGKTEASAAVSESAIHSKPDLPEILPSSTPILDSASATISNQPAVTRAADSQEKFTHYPGDRTWSFGLLPRLKLVMTAAVILFVAVTVAVLITVRFGDRVTGQRNAVSGQSTVTENSRPATPRSNSQTGGGFPPGAVAEPANPETTPNPDEIPKKRPKAPDPTAKKTIAELGSSEVLFETKNVSEEARLAPDPTSSSGPETRPSPITKSIVVEIQIEQGRVMGARIKNSVKGLEAFEASALRVVRQRRYSKESSGIEFVSVNITVNQ